jgi:hypothetical protein
MREDEFKIWLADGHKTSEGHPFAAQTQSTRFSNRRKVERFEGDLDQHFVADKLTSLLNRLAYSKDDERNNRPVRGLAGALIGTVNFGLRLESKTPPNSNSIS